MELGKAIAVCGKYFWRVPVVSGLSAIDECLYLNSIFCKMDNSSNYPYSIEQKLKHYQPPSSAFNDQIDRFEEYSSQRHVPSKFFRARDTHRGPGTYDVPAAARASLAVLRVSTPALYNRDRCLQESFWPKPEGAPIPSIMSQTPGSEWGIQVTSPFKSSGRSKELMLNGSLYCTKHDLVYSSNVGPGMYDMPSLLNTSKRPHTSSPELGPRQRLTTKMPIPKIVKKTDSVQCVMETPLERLSDINKVRGLPDYPR
eukprot:gene10184-21225_t